MARTYYEVLGVDVEASQDEIDAAYRERVKETHPDINDDEDAAEQFREVVRAEEVLSDADERSRYDALGHETYVARESSPDVAGGDGSPWTTGTPGGMTNVSDGTRAGSDSTSSGTTAATNGGPGGTTTGARTTDGAGFRNGSRRDRRRAARAARHVSEDGSFGDATDVGYAVHDWEPGAVQDPGIEFGLTQERVLLSILVFVLYPVFLYSSVSPRFSLATNLVVGTCTLLVLGYLLTMPEIGIVVFGAWSVIAPVLVLALPVVDLLSVVGVLAVLACWIPFGYSIAFARVTREWV